MNEIIFWLCAAGAVYSYFCYPALLLLLPARKTRGDSAMPPVRRVALIIAARNEALNIRKKLENTFSIDTAGVELEIIVASDASDDITDSVVLSYADRGVLLVRSEERRGKERAQRLAIESTEAELLVFTDAGVTLPADSLRKLLERFRDPGVGAVSSVDRFLTADGTLQGEGAYVRYEMWLRDLETRFCSLVGLSGSFFAARRSICSQWDTRVPSDFGTALNCVRAGSRAVSDRNVVGYYRNIADPSKEYRRKLRTVMRGMTGLWIRRDVLNPLKYGRFAFEVFSHKLMRWLVPWFLLGALCANATLAARHPGYLAPLCVQIAIYLSPAATAIVPRLLNIGPVRLCAFFVEVNIAILHATVLTLSGRSMLTWEPSRR